MFKIIYRTLIILATAVLISLGLYWFSGTSAGQSMFARGGGHERRNFSQTTTQSNTTALTQTNPPPQDFGGDFGGREGGVNITRALTDLPGKLGLIAAITAVVVLGRKLLSLISRQHGSGTAVPA
jgi:hypothetical protein